MICLNNHSFPESDIGAVQLESGAHLCGRCVDALLSKPAYDSMPERVTRRSAESVGGEVRSRPVEK